MKIQIDSMIKTDPPTLRPADSKVVNLFPIRQSGSIHPSDGSINVPSSQPDRHTENRPLDFAGHDPAIHRESPFESRESNGPTRTDSAAPRMSPHHVKRVWSAAIAETANELIDGRVLAEGAHAGCEDDQFAPIGDGHARAIDGLVTEPG